MRLLQHWVASSLLLQPAIWEIRLHVQQIVPSTLKQIISSVSTIPNSCLTGVHL
jgi:hypothetical protein